MWRHYVYRHIRPDTKEIFYIGKGSFRKDRAPTYERAYSDHSRNKYWRNIIRKHGVMVEIIASCKTDTDAQRLEKQLIAEIGRLDLNAGPLVNFTDGGDGTCGKIMSEKQLMTLSENAKKPRSYKWIASIRIARKNGGNGGVVKHGDKLPESWRKNIGKAVTGNKNHMFGRTGKDHPNSKAVINMETQERYDSVSAAAYANNLKLKTLYNWLSGHRINPTNLRFA